MGQLPMWKEETSRKQQMEQWDQRCEKAIKQLPLKTLKKLPKIPGVCAKTAKNLKWKSLWYMVCHDETGGIRKGFLRHPIRYGLQLIRSLFSKSSYQREGDFFLYGLDSVDDFAKKLTEKERIFVLGFSYCHKPFECPSGRFTDQCVNDQQSLVCQQCFIGKCLCFSPSDAIVLLIPTVHYVGEKIFEIVHANPERQVVFLITACEMTLKMFGDLGNMVNVKGAGVRLDGRICNTMRAFELSERGIKPGLTVVLDKTQEKILSLLAACNT